MECPKPHGGGAEDVKGRADFGVIACSQRIAEPAPVLFQSGRHQAVSRNPLGHRFLSSEIEILPDVLKGSGVGGAFHAWSHHAICSLLAEVKGKPEKVVLKCAWIAEVESSDAELGVRGRA